MLDALLTAAPQLAERAAPIAVACGLHAVAERLLLTLPSEAVTPSMLHMAAYNLDHATLRVLLTGAASKRCDARTAQTERTPLLCVLAQLVRLIVPADAAVLDEAQFAILDTAEEARALVCPMRALRFEAHDPVMLPLGSADDALEAVRVLTRAGASADLADANGRDASHYWAACVAVARQFHRPSAFMEALVALRPVARSPMGERRPKRARATKAAP